MSIYAPYHLGDVTEYRTKSVDVISSLGTTAYTSGDTMNETTACIRVDSVTVSPAGIAELVQVNVHETKTAGTKQKSDMRLWFFTADYTGAAQNEAMTFPTDMTTCVGYVDITGSQFVDTSANHAFVQTKLHTTPLTIPTGTGTRALYMVVQCKGTPTYDATAALRFEMMWS